MTKQNSSLQLDIQKINNNQCTLTVSVPQILVQKIYDETIKDQQKIVSAYGFSKGCVPIEYIKKNFGPAIMEHLKEFLFNYFVLGFLYKQLRIQKIFFTGEPRLTDMKIDLHKGAHFTFNINTFSELPLKNWKFFPFKAPKRKKYKDLDRQVESFIKHEKEELKKKDHSLIALNDWISFNISIVNKNHQPILENYKENVWLKIGNEAGDKEFQDLFISKKIGETFYTNAQCIQDYFSAAMNTNYTFCIEIIDILPASFFCLEQFKKHFKLKTNKETTHRLIEVFSFRNDLSQRQSMVEESLKLLLNKHKFNVPPFITLRQQKKVLAAIKNNPDYHVYRMQKDFEETVNKLAEKQIKEIILLDQVASSENIAIGHDDIKQYLNLTNRPRMKNFIYVNPPETKLSGRELPISSEILKQTCLREKTLNYIIHHLTKA